MNLIKGQKVKLHTKVQIDVDPFGASILGTPQIIEVDNVLISPTSDTDIVNDIQLYGKASVYTLSIPKGDQNDWTDTIVEFYGKSWRTFGDMQEYQEELVPLQWNKKIRVLKNE